MAFAPIGPVVDKVIEKSVEFVPVIGPGLKYIKTAKKVTKFTNPVKATTYTAGMLYAQRRYFNVLRAIFKIV